MNIFRRLFGRTGSPGANASAYTEPASGLVFPMELGGMRRLAGGQPYAEGGRAGVSIPYGGDSAQATVYVTTVGRADFPDGGESEFIRGELDGAMAAVREMERLGHYRSVKFFAAAPERLGTEPGNLVWARGAFFTVTNGGPLISFTYLTALRRKLIKLRISVAAPDHPALKQFPHALGDLISRQRLASGRR